MNSSRKRLPAEWEEQAFLQLTFPHTGSDWNYLIEEVSACFVEIITAASQFQKMLVVCNDINHVKQRFANTRNIHFTEAASNDTWARDHGGITVIENRKAIIQDYIFNGWGNKFEAGLDNNITKTLFSNGVFGQCGFESFDFVLEGGSIESDGRGTILTTAGCLLSENRNRGLSQQDIESKLKANFGAERFLWLTNGYLAGDDTDSHIDTLARFCNENTIAYVGCSDSTDEHFRALSLMKEEMKEFKTTEGQPYKLVELPIPDACFDSDGLRLPATYANFTIINNAVLVPVYGVAQDKRAVDILRQCFPRKHIIAINCRVLIEQHGSLHCVTMQYPKPVGLNIDVLN